LQCRYIRDHLGYRLELQSAEWPDTLGPSLPATFNFSAMLLNWGFAGANNREPKRNETRNERDFHYDFSPSVVDNFAL
jgi:hypothetical protein